MLCDALARGAELPQVGSFRGVREVSAPATASQGERTQKMEFSAPALSELNETPPPPHTHLHMHSVRLSLVSSEPLSAVSLVTESVSSLRYVSGGELQNRGFGGIHPSESAPPVTVNRC